ncbi:MAG: FAD-dependent oxidoreductase [Proteobacteria bacterium]|nr:FAD-dependent oxidoreductase [Pseudomonadota bacterium]
MLFRRNSSLGRGARRAPIGRPAPRSAIVVGAGVVGVATAYALARRGVAVTVVDRQAAPGSEASFANGAQLSYSYSDALGSPALLRKTAAVLLGADPAIRLRASLDPDRLHWLLKLLRNATGGRFMANTLEGLKLGLESRLSMIALQQEHSLQFDHAVPGKLLIYSEPHALAAARAMVRAKQRLGVEQHVLDGPEVIGLEPALAGYAGRLVGAVYSPQDAVGDPHRFCLEMARLLQQAYGATIRLNTGVTAVGGDGASGWVETEGVGRISADELVICAGIGSAAVGRQFGLRHALMPMKGYSFTAPPGATRLKVSVTDVARKIVLCPLGGGIRVAGWAEMGSMDTTVDPGPLNWLRAAAQQVLPNVADYSRIGAGWAGLRPMSPNSLPRIARVAPRVSVNVGHGMLGWTYAMGSAERLARMVAEENEGC